MEKVTHKQLVEHLLHAYKIGSISVFLHGLHGTGKSQAIKAVAQTLAKEMKLEFTENGKENEKTFGFRDVRLAQMESVDLRGTPKVEDGKTKWFAPDWIPENTESHGIMFFDEFDKATPSVQNASLQIMLDRKIGNAHIPDGWMILTAGNMSDENAHSFEISSVLNNRFKHFELIVPTPKLWTEWAIQNGINSHIVAFLNFKPQYIYKYDENTKDVAHPTPRTWQFCSQSIEGVTDTAFMEREVASCVGKGVAIEFSSWYKMQEKVDLDAIVKNPELVTKVKEISLKWAVVSGLSEKYKSDRKILEPLLEVVKLIEPEFGFILLGYLRSTDKMAFGKIVTSKIWKEVASKYGKYLD